MIGKLGDGILWLVGLSVAAVTALVAVFAYRRRAGVHLDVAIGASETQHEAAMERERIQISEAKEELQERREAVTEAIEKENLDERSEAISDLVSRR